MSTDITADMFLASVRKWLGPEGGKWRFYKTKADWLVHNRNGAGNNTRATPGGYGPLKGGAAHNTASTSQTGMLAYLYSGDLSRGLPGPLCNWAVDKSPQAVLMGWGTSNATGPGDPRAMALVEKNQMPLDSELVPRTAGPSDPNAILYAPYFAGNEACHAEEGPTAGQYEIIVLMWCAYFDCLGGSAKGYDGGSLVMHRELTTTRSDPQGIPKNGKLRRDVNARLKAGPPSAPAPTPEPPVTQKPVAITLDSNRDSLTKGESLMLTATVQPAIPGYFYVDYTDSSMTGYKRFYTETSKTGKITVPNTPSRNVTYRVGFAPTDSTNYQKSPWAYVTVLVVDLGRLMLEHKAALDKIADLETRVAALEGPDAPVATLATTPGDTP